jgi:SAM-dependent methyltransferase
MTSPGTLADVEWTDDATNARFYDGLAADYELVYAGDWDAAIARQADALAELFRDVGASPRDVLDCACGIGTQAIGLARLGLRVVGTDVSETAIRRARREAGRLGAEASFAVADFRDLSGVAGRFDAVLACDNAVPHLLAPSDVPQALAQMRTRLRSGGLLVVTIRDYDRALEARPATALPLVVEGPPRRVLVRLHDWDDGEPLYTVRLLVLTETADGWRVAEHAGRYRAITRRELSRAAQAAGFRAIAWHAGRPIVGDQLVLTARNP